MVTCMHDVLLQRWDKSCGSNQPLWLDLSPISRDGTYTRNRLSRQKPETRWATELEEN